MFDAVLLLGPTGSGKSPLGDRLAIEGLWNRPCSHFDFGENLRRATGHTDSPLERDQTVFLQEILRTGALLEDDRFPIAETILRHFLDQQPRDPRGWIILNGLPRHVGQAERVDRIVRVLAVIVLECSAQTVATRIARNVGGDRTDRDDDDRELIGRKLDIYHARTAPLVAHYRRQARVIRLPVTISTTPADCLASLARIE